MPENHQLEFAILAFLGASVFFVPLFKRLGLDSIVGYIAAGITIGPFGFRLITDVGRSMQLAELGVILLLFVIGLELQPSKLWQMKYKLLGLGGLQILFTTLGLSVPLFYLLPNPSAAFMAAFTLSISSTAFALQSLSERRQLNTEHGRSAFAILLMQDLAAIPALTLIPIFWSAHAASTTGLQPLKIIAAFVVIILASRFAVRPFFRFIVKSNNRDLFTVTTLALVLGTALLMTQVGLSMALGTFVAGVLLADSEYRHAIEADIAPFKGLFMGLFFVSVGMSMDIKMLINQPLLLLTVTLGYMAIKFCALFLVGKVFRFKNEVSRQMALNLSQGSEFAFVLMASLYEFKAISEYHRSFFILVVILSMCLSPLLLVLHDRLNAKIHKNAFEKEFDKFDSEEVPVLIAGFGRFGQIFGRLLRIKNIPFVAIDHNSEQIDVIRRFGNQIYYGDASRGDLLEAAGARKAKFLVIAVDNVETSLKIAELAKENFPHLKIYARARNRGHAFQLMDLGVSHIKRETIDSAINFTEELLVDYGLPPQEVESLVSKFRSYDLETLAEQFKVHRNENEMIAVSKQAAQQFSETLRADAEASISK